MRKILLFLSFNILLFSSVFAGQGLINLTGTWVGKRFQYNEDKQAYLQTFTYMYDLKQVNDIVSGTSYIKNEEGNYAEVAIRGIVLDNKFYFEEYQMIRAERPDGKIWCFKKGELTISQKNGELVLSGETQSYTEDFGEPCSGGVSYMTKLNDYTNSNPTEEDILSVASGTSQVVISNFPNPFVETTTISVKLEEESDIKVDIIDITGKVIDVLYDSKKAAGFHNITLESSRMGVESRILIARLKIGEKVYTKNLIQQLF